MQRLNKISITLQALTAQVANSSATSSQNNELSTVNSVLKTDLDKKSTQLTEVQSNYDVLQKQYQVCHRFIILKVLLPF